MIFNRQARSVAAIATVLLAATSAFANVVEVTVAPNGDVRLIGDKFDNDVAVNANPDGTFYVFGLNGTQILFEDNIYWSWENITLDNTSPKSSIKFDMREGDDDLGIGVLEALHVDGTMGKGDDFFALFDVYFFGRMNVDGGPGGDEDLIYAELLTVDGNARIRLAESDSGNYLNGVPYFSGVVMIGFTIRSNLNIICAKGIHEVSLWSGWITGRTDINFGSGDDTGQERLDLWQTQCRKSLRVVQTSGELLSTVDESNVAGTANFSLGAGNDELTSWMSAFQSSVTMNGGAGEDLVSLEFAEALGNVVLNGGPDEDDLIIDGSQLLSNVTLNGNAGHDYLGLHESTFALDSVIRINGSSGNDHFESISPANALVRRLIVNLAGGDDGLTFDWNQFSASAGIYFNGGAGTDILNAASTTFVPVPFEVGFEN